MGLVAATAAYLQFLRAFTRRHGIVLIADEVLNFRMGYRGAAAQLGLEPDITAFGKIIGGGLPIGTIAGRRETMPVLVPSKRKPAVAQAGPFTHYPLSMVSGAAAIALLTPQAVHRMTEMGTMTSTGSTRALASRGLTDPRSAPDTLT